MIAEAEADLGIEKPIVDLVITGVPADLRIAEARDANKVPNFLLCHRSKYLHYLNCSVFFSALKLKFNCFGRKYFKFRLTRRLTLQLNEFCLLNYLINY